jgi:hypothetical protein
MSDVWYVLTGVTVRNWWPGTQMTLASETGLIKWSRRVIAL